MLQQLCRAWGGFSKFFKKGKPTEGLAKSEGAGLDRKNISGGNGAAGDDVLDVVFEKSDYLYKNARIDTISLTFHTRDGNELYFGYISFKSFLRAIRRASCRNPSDRDCEVSVLP